MVAAEGVQQPQGMGCAQCPSSCSRRNGIRAAELLQGCCGDTEGETSTRSPQRCWWQRVGSRVKMGVSPPPPNNSCSLRQTITKPDVRQGKTCLSSRLSGHAIFWRLEPGTGEGGLGKLGSLGDAQGDGGWLPAPRHRPRL